MKFDLHDFYSAQEARVAIETRLNFRTKIRLGVLPEERPDVALSKFMNRGSELWFSLPAGNQRIEICLTPTFLAKVYRATGSVGQVINWFELPSVKGLKDFLMLAGVDVIKEMYDLKTQNISINKIADAHEIKPATISYWFKMRGFKVLKGYHKVIEDAEIHRRHKDKLTIPQQAEILGISSSTLIKKRHRTKKSRCSGSS